MLIVTAQQITNVNEICDYDVHVYVNKREIWSSRIENHNRVDGFPDLLQRIANAAESGHKEKK
jgi:hypothetical protein